MNLFAGLDISTQSAKIVVIDSEINQTIYKNSVNYDEDLPKYRTRNGARQGVPTRVSESDPNMWLDAIQRYPESPVLHKLLAVLYHKSGKLKDAYEKYERRKKD